MNKLTFSFIIIFCFILCACGSSKDPEPDPVVFDFSEEYYGDVDPQGLQLSHGDVVSILQNGDVVILTAKVKENLTNKMIIDQNYYIVEDLIKDNGFNTCNRLKYMSVMDVDGDEMKVVSFDLNKEIIDKVYNEQIFGSQIGDNAENLWINNALK